MNNEVMWRPTRILRNESGQYSYNKKEVYSGSWHIAGLHVDAYVPLLQSYARGRILDCGCGQLPWYVVYKELVTFVYAVDWSDHPKVTPFLDEKRDLSLPFQLKETSFDTVLLTDVIAHIASPDTLIQSIAWHLKQGGHLVLTTPFVYWISEYPAEYYRMTDAALRQLCEKNGLQVIHLEPYGGRADVLLDTLNKGMTDGLAHRLFRMLASVVKKTSWYKKVNLKTRYSYPLGYTLVAKKK